MVVNLKGDNSFVFRRRVGDDIGEVTVQAGGNALTAGQDLGGACFGF
jgi:hypothetical protein